jgi:hypothetical protein
LNPACFGSWAPCLKVPSLLVCVPFLCNRVSDKCVQIPGVGLSRWLHLARLCIPAIVIADSEHCDHLIRSA